METGRFNYPLNEQTLEIGYTLYPSLDGEGPIFNITSVGLQTECPGHAPFFIDIGQALFDLPVDWNVFETLAYQYYLDHIQG